MDFSFGSKAAIQNSEKTSIQCPTLPDSRSQSRLERHSSPWAVRAAGLQHFEWLFWSKIGGRLEEDTHADIEHDVLLFW